MKNLPEIEKRIVALLKQGDKQAIRLIYENYSETLYGVIFQMLKNEEEAEDVFQEALLKFWRFSSAYDSSKGRLFTWMLNICKNTAIDRLRSKRFKEQRLIQGSEDLVGIGERLGEEGFDPEQLDLKDWVNKLEPRFLQIILIVYFEGYSHTEAAKRLDMPLGTLKTRVRQALKELRKMMKE